MNLSLGFDRMAVCQLAPDAPVPAWVSDPAFFVSITRTSEELSIVCPEALVPPGIRQERGWRMFQVTGPLDFALTGIFAALAGPLAQAGVSIFALSTYNTDYVLVKDSQVTLAVKVLQAAGHTIKAS